MNKYGLKNFSNSAKEIDLNCASWALDLDYWYFPYDEAFDPEMYVRELFLEGYSHSEIESILIEQEVNRLLSDFPTLRELPTPIDVGTDEELVAFRIYVEDEASTRPDYDFHFRVFRDGRWQEKLGFANIRDCEGSIEDDWEIEFSTYNSEIIYFGRKKI